jgi:hypothetical protein
LNSIEKAEAHAKSLYDLEHATKIIVAEIHTFGLVPAELLVRKLDGDSHQNIMIPMWFDKSSFDNNDARRHPVDESLLDKTTIWVTVDEMRTSQTPVQVGHPGQQEGEWLACGHILPSAIKQVVPFDGTKVVWDSVPQIWSREVNGQKFRYHWGRRDYLGEWCSSLHCLLDASAAEKEEASKRRREGRAW